MTTPTMKELCERADIQNGCSLDEYADAVRSIKQRLSPATVMRVVEALELATLKNETPVDARIRINAAHAALRLLDGREENLP